MFCQLSNEPIYVEPLKEQKIIVYNRGENEEDQEELFQVSLSFVEKKLNQYLMQKEGIEIKKLIEKSFKQSLSKFDITPTSELKTYLDRSSGTTVKIQYMIEAIYRNEPLVLWLILIDNNLSSEVRYLERLYGKGFQSANSIDFNDYDIETTLLSFIKSFKQKLDQLRDNP